MEQPKARFGSAHTMAAIVDDPERKQAFMDIIRDFASDILKFASDILKEVVGVRPAWPNPPCTAPEHERASNS